MLCRFKMEFPEVTFSVSATTTGNISARLSKKSSKRSKKAREIVALAGESKAADLVVDAVDADLHQTPEKPNPASAKASTPSHRAHVDSGEAMW
jgi:hypothetical protein